MKQYKFDASHDRILGKLPDPMTMRNGESCSAPEMWRERRREIIEDNVSLEFGGMPPIPEFLRVETLWNGGPGHSWYRIFTGTEAKPFSFTLEVFRPKDGDDINAVYPKKDGKRPVLLCGDMCFDTLTDDVVREAVSRGFIFTRFNRVEFAPDMYNSDRNSGIYLTYPGMSFSAISAWAWGYCRAVDALLGMGDVDESAIAISGHSRGGKTVLLAGAVDERIAFVNPNDSGAHGCGCYRYEQNEPDSADDKTCEKLADMFRAIPYWMGAGLKDYIGRENELPHDMHYFKALVAPRCLLETEAYGDVWAKSARELADLSRGEKGL